MKKLFLPLSLFAILTSATAQPTNQEDVIKKVITQMFEAMSSSNEQVLRNAFYENAILETVYRKDGEHKIHRSSIDEFITQIMVPHKEEWKEEINSWEIKIDGDMASVWTPYTFYLDGKRLHCGVNSFQMHQSDKGWKITYIIDTRKREGCD